MEKLFNLDYKFGQPLIECSPFAHVVIKNQKGSFCDYCLKKFEIDPISCTNCKNNYYCNRNCLKMDNHKVECELNLLKQIKQLFVEPYDQNDEFNFYEYFSTDDIIDYTLLFFRILRNSNACNRDGNFLLKKIATPINFRASLKRPRSENELNDSLSNDNFNKHFKNMYIDANIKFILKNIIDDVVFKNINPNCSNDHNLQSLHDQFQLNNNVIKKDNTEKKIESKKEINKELVESFFDDLKNFNVFDKYEYIYDEFKNYFSNCFTAESTLSNDANTSDSINETILNDDDFNDSIFYSSPPNNEINYVSKYLNFDSTIIDKDEAEAIELIRTNFQLTYLEYLSKKTKRHETELKCYFGSWLDKILKLLSNNKIDKYFNYPNYYQIEKFFYITIRYSIASCDKIGLTPIARCLYLPLTKLEHSCLANTSVVFNGNIMQIYYLDKNPTEPFVNVKLNLSDIKVDFNHDISAKNRSRFIYILSKIRLLNCSCDRCKCTKVLVESELNDFEDENESTNRMSDEEDSFDYNMDEWQNHKQSSDYNIFFSISQANLLYGNRQDFEYCRKIQDHLVGMIDTIRFNYGYYHKQITILLLMINYCNFTVMKSSKDDVEIFLHLVYCHRHNFELINSLSITHGIHNRWITRVQDIHKTYHYLLEKIFNRSRSEINEFLSLYHFKKDPFKDSRIFSLENCANFKELPVIDSQIISIRNAYNKNKLAEDDDAYQYNPYISNDSITSNSIKSDNQQLVTEFDQCLAELNEISELSLFRYI